MIKTGGNVGWTGTKTKYFLAAFVPIEAERAISKAYLGGDETIGVSLETQRPAGGTQEYLVYVGPLDYNDLKAYGLGLERAVDFGWKFISPLSRLVFAFMLWVHRAIPNYGVVIILLSVIIKILFWPLTQKSFKSMREMQKVQPALAALKEKHKDDPKSQCGYVEALTRRGVSIPRAGVSPCCSRCRYSSRSSTCSRERSSSGEPRLCCG